ncbi:isoamyl acetate-hydrolyzing esterase 1 [Willisornis vidua]|uniref:Isoamyl acetate-hydrolyzing esterase 1 homolog n=1 Tax=Willisornis vidua TaxID=1566151 RepID=A0ABQ9D6J1_9PASS|nr:isoamyl acetate-hydrolyzing esterase 1 [Willisornis vidua]
MALAGPGTRGRALRWPRVLLFGDSITEYSFQENGWGANLADRLVRKCDVLNRGISGYNTRWAKLILPRLITESTNAESIVAITIFFGANDSALKELNPKQHVPLEEYASNLKSMIQYLKSVDITEDRIILITPPPLQESAWEKACLAKVATGLCHESLLCHEFLYAVDIDLTRATSSSFKSMPHTQMHLVTGIP